MSDWTRRIVELPDSMIEFFASVSERIRAEDDAATIESDDLLQADRIYGGLTDRRRQIYDFTWFPETVPEERWELRLTADEIDEIGSGFRRQQHVKAYRR